MLLLGVGAAVGLGAMVRPQAQEQLERGERLYAFWCASCHGRGGEGGQQVPALAGPSRRYPCRFPDARALYEWVSRSMPPEDVLRPREYWDILAFLLWWNGELPRGLVLGPATAPGIPLRACPQRR